MIYIGNTVFTTAKSARYLGNVGLVLEISSLLGQEIAAGYQLHGKSAARHCQCPQCESRGAASVRSMDGRSGPRANADEHLAWRLEKFTPESRPLRIGWITLACTFPLNHQPARRSNTSLYIGTGLRARWQSSGNSLVPKVFDRIGITLNATQ